MVRRDKGAWPSSSASVEVPAHPDFVASVRAMTRAMAVLGDMTLDDLEELQMAVDEAAILLLPLVHGDGRHYLRADYEIEDGGLRVTLSVPCREGESVDREGLPWMMLVALDPDVAVTSQSHETSIGIHRLPRSLRS